MNPLFPFEYVILASLLLLGFSAFCAWHSTSRCSRLVRIGIVGLRFAAVASLLAIVLNPGIWWHEPKEKPGEWVVLADVSSSMSTADVKGRPRWNEAGRLAEKIFADPARPKCRLFTFSSHLSPVESPARLTTEKCNGETTDIIGAVKGLLDLFQTGQTRLQGVILLSDGRQVGPADMVDLAAHARARQIPVFPVVLGGKIESRHLTVSTDRRQYIAFKDHPVKITAILSGRNLPNIAPVVRLVDDTGRTIARQQVKMGGQTSTKTEFELTPDRLGYRSYAVSVDPWDSEEAPGAVLRVPSLIPSFRIGVQTLESRIRVLLVEGMPCWDSKFLTLLFQKQQNIQLTAICRLSADRFFGLEDGRSPAQGAPQPVFPDSAEGFDRYDLIIFGKGIEYFLDSERIRLLTDFVRERGGGVVFARGKPYHQRLPDLENLEPIEWGSLREGNFDWQPTTLGEEAGLFRDLLPVSTDPVWQKLPPLSQAWDCARSRGFTQVLAEGVPVSGVPSPEGAPGERFGNPSPGERFGSPSRRFPVVFSQRFGKGLVVGVNSEGLWKWNFFPTCEEAGKIYRNFWAQLLQWLMTYSDFLPGHDYSLRLSDTEAGINQPILARIACRAKESPSEGRARAGGTIRNIPLIRVLDGASVVQEIVLSAGASANQWEGIFSLKKAGSYRVELVTGTGRDQEKSGAILCETLQIRAAPSEKDELSANPDFLNDLATRTGGRVMVEENLAELFQPPASAADVFHDDLSQWKSTWNHGWFLALILFFLGTEWFARRRNGLI